jgi:hypothetical protein
MSGRAVLWRKRHKGCGATLLRAMSARAAWAALVFVFVIGVIHRAEAFSGFAFSHKSGGSGAMKIISIDNFPRNQHLPSFLLKLPKLSSKSIVLQCSLFNKLESMILSGIEDNWSFKKGTSFWRTKAYGVGLWSEKLDLIISVGKMSFSASNISYPNVNFYIVPVSYELSPEMSCVDNYAPDPDAGTMRRDKLLASNIDGFPGQSSLSIGYKNQDGGKGCDDCGSEGSDAFIAPLIRVHNDVNHLHEKRISIVGTMIGFGIIMFLILFPIYLYFRWIDLDLD